MTTTSLLGRSVVAFVGLVTAFVMVGGTAVLPAHGQLNSTQIQAILDLLTSFGADTATINNVNAALNGQPTSGTGSSGSGSSGTACYNFTRSLHINMSPKTGADVVALQDFLTATGDFNYSGGSTGFFGSITRDAVASWQASSGVSPAVGYFGPLSQAEYNTQCGTSGSGSGSGNNGSETTVPVSGSLTASLAATSPAQGVVITGQGVARLADFLMVNGANTSANVTKVTLDTEYISNDTDYSNVYLYEGGVRLTDAASVTDGTITFNDSAGLFSIAPGASRTINVRVDIGSGATGKVMGVSLQSVEANVPVAGALPILGAAQSVAAGTLATVDFNTTTEPSATANVEPNNDVRLFQNTVSVSSNEVNLTAMSFRNTGSTQSNDLINFDLFVDGDLVASKANMDGDRYVRFDFTNNPVFLDTGNHIIRLEGDIVGGASRTYDFEIRTTGDALFLDAELGAAVVPTKNGSSFSATSGATQTIASSTGGSVTVSKANTSPLDDVSTGATNVKLATFEFRASGERMKIENLDVNAGTASAGEGGLDNGKVFVNGAQVGSTKDLTEATDVNFTFGSSFQINPGQTSIVDIYADTKTTTGTNLTAEGTITITVGTGSSNAQGISSLQTSNVPTTDTSANTVTVKGATATVTKFSGYGDQTRPAGSNNLRVGSFVISAGSTEGIDVNTVVVDLSAAEAASITNMRLVDNSTGNQLGTTKNSPSTSNSYSVNVSIPKSGTKVIDLFADVKSGANNGSWIAEFGELTANGQTTGTSISVTTNVALQTITIGSGSIAVAKGAGDPNSENLVGGINDVKVGEFEFTATNSDFDLQEVIIKISNNSASSVSAVKLRYKNEAGNTVTTSGQAVTASPTQANATATFTGLTGFIKADETMAVEVLVDTVDVDVNGSSGSTINVTLDFDNGFKAVDAAGTQTTSVGSADVSSDGTFYIRKTIPTFAQVDLGGNPTSGNALYEFTVSADAQGRVDIKKVTFDVITSGVTITDFYLREKGDSTDINDVDPESDSGNDVEIFAGTSSDDDVIAISAGSSKTFQLFGTVTGWGDDGDSVTITFAEDASAQTPVSSASLTSSAELIWSDRSATSHTTITADWTNGFLIDDFGSDVQSFST